MATFFDQPRYVAQVIRGKKVTKAIKSIKTIEQKKKKKKKRILCLGKVKKGNKVVIVTKYIEHLKYQLSYY